jgi:hypothetical protein
MPSLRIPFPEKESPSVVVLRGKRITVGRLPQNTIQIRDRTISACHAELIEEDGHYRLHDAGATNGVLVDGEPVTDFHLEAACKVTFGGVECEFSPEVAAEAEDDPSLAILTHGQSEAILAKNSELEKTVADLREKIAELQKPAGDAPGAGDLQRLTEEANSLRESLAARDGQIKQLKTDLAVMHRDRANLQRALNEAKSVTAEPASAPAPALAPAPATVAKEEKQPELELAPAAEAETTPVAPAAPAEPASAEPPPAPAPAAAETPKRPVPTARPAAVPVPALKPAASFPPVKTVAPPSKPGLPKPNSPLPHATSGAPSSPAPSNPGTAAARPVSRPQPAVASNGNGTPGAPRAAAPFAKSPGGTNPQATPKPSLATRPPTAVSGPKGTQKIETES